MYPIFYHYYPKYGISSVLCFVLTVTANPAIKNSYDPKFLIDSKGYGQHQLKEPDGVAIQFETGNIFVGDTSPSFS